MNKIVPVLLVTSIGLGLMSLHLVNEVRSDKATIEALQAQVAELKKARTPVRAPADAVGVITESSEDLAGRLSAAAQSVPPPTGPQRSMFPPPPGADASRAAGPAEPDWRRDRGRQMREQQRELLKDPQYRAAMLVQQRTGIAQYYKDVGIELGLGAETTDALLDLLAEQQVRRMEQPPLAYEPGQAPEIGEAQRSQERFQAMQQRNQEELGALLGADKAQAFKDYQSNAGARQMVHGMRDTLASQGMPLDDDTVRSMVQAVGESQRRMRDEVQPTATAFSPTADPRESVEMMQRQMDHIAENQKRTLEAMSPYLTATQRRVVEQQQSAQRMRQEAQLQMIIKQREAQARGSQDASGAQLTTQH